MGLVDFPHLRTLDIGHCETLGLLSYSRLPVPIKPPELLGSPKPFGRCGPHGPSESLGPSGPSGPPKLSKPSRHPGPPEPPRLSLS